MTADYGDFELALRWDRERDAFDMFLHFTDRVHDRSYPGEPLTIDLHRLAQLVIDEPAYGAALTEMVFQQKEMAQFFEEAIAAAREMPVRLRINIQGPSRFHSVRWESLREPVNGHAIATSRNILFSRYVSSADWLPIPLPPAREPRALVVIANPSDLAMYAPRGRRLPPLTVSEEIARAQQALSAYRPVILAEPGKATMTDTLDCLARFDDGFDVLYFVAHGALTSDDVPLLYLEKPDGTADPVDGRRLVEHIQELERKPRVVMLRSAQSPGSSGEFESGDDGALAGLAPRLAAAGVAAVVSMQANITLQTVERFVPQFFTELFGDGVVDRAMAVARDAVRDRQDWWVPVLFSRLRSGRIYSWPARLPSVVKSVFVSYSHKDERYLDQLVTSLSQVRRKLISMWHDGKILPGQDWGREIDQNLEEADIVLLLVSPDFLNSEYAYSREMTRALERHKSGQAVVVPIILRPSDWQNSPLEGLEVLPSKGRAVTRWSNRDEAWLDVAQGLRRLISNQR